MSDNSTRKPRSRKAAAGRPKKPYPDFPLTPHASGTWQKKIRGKIHYFGRWARQVNGKLERIPGDGWEEALASYKAQADDLHAGRTPRVRGGELTVAGLCNHFLTAKQRKVTSGELGSRMFNEYRETTDLIVSAFGGTRLVDDLAADDFAALRERMAERWGPVRLGNGITRVKSVFKFAVDNRLIDKPPHYGSEFKKPGKSVLRRHRAISGVRMLEVDELRQLIGAAPVPLKTMILLGLNCGFGNADCGALPLTAVDLDAGMIDYPRPKTGIGRRCPLWPETIAAIREALAKRPQPRDAADADVAFLQASGRRWVRPTGMHRTENIGVAFTTLLKRLGLHRDGIGFYTLRHVFRTVADAARDPVAIDLIMGHSDPSMGGHYRERVEDSRLKAVTEHVREWLFGEAPEDGTTEADSTTLESNDPSDAPQGNEDNERPTLRLFAG